MPKEMKQVKFDMDLMIDKINDMADMDIKEESAESIQQKKAKKRRLRRGP